ncbi:PASTA domain-containing protein [Atopobium fossor]|uniref:PASTA domain-containing protein n=1 Tax=Atopobium fossor TaxID=39487 RepID=UPI0003F668A1|nr:PASTA domain-containing protein [Atopobium fossor]
MNCPNCGTEIPEGMAYCPSCSQKVIKHLSEEASALASLEVPIPAAELTIEPAVDITTDISSVPAVSAVEPIAKSTDELTANPVVESESISPNKPIHAEEDVATLTSTPISELTPALDEQALVEEPSEEVLPQYDENSVVVRPIEESEPILAPSDARPKTRQEKRAMRARLRTMRIALARGIEQRGDPHLHVHDNDLSAKAAPVQPISKVKEVHMFRRQIILGALFACIILVILGGLYGAWSTGLIGGVTVPDVRGRSAADATAVLTDAGFDVNLAITYVDDSAGLVVNMVPKPGERQPYGQTITVQVSEQRVIPNIVGKTFDEAAKELYDRGYDVVTVTGVDAVEKSDIVTAVTPDEGTSATVEQSITLTVKRAE